MNPRTDPATAAMIGAIAYTTGLTRSQQIQFIERYYALRSLPNVSEARTVLAEHLAARDRGLERQR